MTRTGKTGHADNAIQRFRKDCAAVKTGLSESGHDEWNRFGKR
jgi:hypothetical protein